ncbi:MAG: hypothetical protein PUD60_06145 [Akkermansia muciniphila]|nr:hypothetical protein [Akkermansia muciniphila]
MIIDLEKMQSNVAATAEQVGEILRLARGQRVEECEWVTTSDIMNTYKISRESAERLVEAGRKRGDVKVRVFQIAGRRPVMRVDAVTFDAFLESGGINDDEGSVGVC